MNLPNQLTMARIIMVPVVMALMLMGYEIPALIVFAVASITDFLDGYIARKKNLVSSFGKIMDPLADKLLSFGALICFIQMGIVSVWAPMIIIAREFFVTSMRVVAVSKGKVIAASWWGKIKTIFQMVAIIVAILLFLPVFSQGISVLITDILVWISAVITVVSGYDYVAKNSNLIKEAK
jgi:CDP-diacylglycerol--glycerol-3-phosphate 3-phosphatidyltransferase